MMMKNTRIATRIAAGFGLILLMLAVLAGFTWNRMDRLQAIDAQAQMPRCLRWRRRTSISAWPRPVWRWTISWFRPRMRIVNGCRTA